MSSGPRALAVTECVPRAAELRPTASAVRFLGDDRSATAEALSYRELHIAAGRVARFLVERGVNDSPVLLLLPPGLGYVTWLVGCLYAGVVVVPAYPPRFNRPLQSLHAIAKDSRARFAITTDAIRYRIEASKSEWPSLQNLDWLLASDVGETWEPLEPLSYRPEALSILQYTSGSTREPRGVELSAGNLAANVGLLADHIGGTASDRVVAWLPPYHDMGLIGAILCPLCMGAETILMSPGAFLQRPLVWLEAISTYRGTLSGGPDFAYRLCVKRTTAEQRKALDLRSWRVAFSGAERVRAESMEMFAEAFAPSGFAWRAFSPCYGLAEATLGVTFTAPDEAPKIQQFDETQGGDGAKGTLRARAGAQPLVSSGRPLAGVDVRIVDTEQGHELPEGSIGEVWVRGASVARGYWKQSELTRQVFQARLGDGSGEYLRTGDLGYFWDGELFVTGRSKDLIVILGENYHPEDIEPTIEAAHPSVREGGSTVFSLPVAGEEVLVVVAEVRNPKALDHERVAHAIRRAVAEAHHLPVHEVVLIRPGTLAKTSSGKRRRGLCRQQYIKNELSVLSRETQRPRADATPSNDLVQQVAALMAETLGLDRVEPDDDFFALGGHSLMATRLAARLEQRYGIEASVAAVFEAPSPARLAVRVARHTRGGERLPVRRIDRRGPIRLSYSQERMWFLQQLEPQGTAYNVAGALEIAGALRADHLAAAFRALVDRHEILRSNYESVDGAPVVRINERLEIDLPLVDLSQSDAPLARARELGTDLASVPFFLDRDPLIRLRLFRLGPDRHMLVVCLHHIVADAWSLGVMLSECMTDYEAIQSGSSPVRRDGTIQYLDYAAWQREWVEGPRLARELDYWRGCLAGAPNLDLPSDRERGALVSSAGALEWQELPEALHEAVVAFAAARRATPFMVMLQVFQILLYRYTGQDDVVIGVPIANRNHVASEPFIGTLVNMLPLRLRLNAKESFFDLLERTREVCLAAYAHQELPFERLVAELGLERKPGQSPLFQVMFDYQNTPLNSGSGSRFRFKPAAISRRASQFDLSLSILDSELGHQIGIEYKTELFDAQTVQRLLGHYLRLLDSALFDPSCTVGELPMLDTAERARLLKSGRGEQGSFPVASFVFEIEAFAEAKPGAPAVRDAEETLSYRELVRASRWLGARLVRSGARPGQRLAVCMGRSRFVPVALLAVLRIGCAYVPIDPDLPEERKRLMFADAAPLLIVADTASAAKLAPFATVPIVQVDSPAEGTSDAADAGALDTAPIEPMNPEDTAYVMYTSGSTGTPKGVEVPFGALQNLLHAMAECPGLDESDHLLSVTRISFDISALELFLPLLRGARLTIASATDVLDPRALSRRMEESKPTIMQATPTLWRMLIDAGWPGAPHLKILSGGEALSRTLAGQLLLRGSELYNLYGPTETTVWSTVERVLADTPIAVGRPIQATNVYVMDAHGDLAPIGVKGEICIGGAGVAKGYLNRPELTSERFVADPFMPGARMYRTGDVGRFRPDGVLECFGRIDHQVKVRGHRVELGEIEACLERLFGVAQAVVVGHRLDTSEGQLIAYFVARGAVDISEIKAALRRSLPFYMVPNHFVELEVFPRTSSGKVDRRALPLPDTAAPGSAESYVPPRDEEEAALARIWRDVLGTEHPSVTDNFFDFGHSLLAARLFARIQKELRVDLPLAVLFRAPTIADLAREVVVHRAGTQPPAAATFEYLVPVRDRGQGARLFCVHGAGGNVLNLDGLARHLNPQYSFFGLQARGVDGRSTPHDSIEEMASAYLREIKTVQPRGPYLLSGYCGGGLIAYEMAQKLLSSGESVDLLALIDTFHPRVRISTPSMGEKLLATRYRGPEYLLELGQAKVQRDLTRAVRNLRVRYYRKVGQQMPHVLREHWLIDVFARCMRAYEVRSFPGSIVLFKARDVPPDMHYSEPDLGWRGIAEGGLFCYEIPGDHHTMAEEPNVRMVAEQLNARLGRAKLAG